MLDFPPLQLARDAELRLFQMSDAREYFQLIDANRTDLKTWLPWLNSSTSVQDTIDFIKLNEMRLDRNLGYGVAILWQGQIAGSIGYHDINWLGRNVEIGYWLAPAFRGKGLMTRAVTAMTENAFTKLELKQVEIRCATQNHASRAIPERLGFTQEGIIPQSEWLYDHFVDLVVYGMLSEEWQTRHSGSYVG